MNRYHNTTNTEEPVLSRYEHKAKSQEEAILNWFRAGTRFHKSSPSTVARIVFRNAVPLTSVRRAMTNLANAGDLVKTDKQVKGPYGRPEYLWKLAEKHRQAEMF